MSDSHVPVEGKRRRLGCFPTILLVIVALVVTFFVWDAVAAGVHQVRGRQITRMGSELLEVLDSYGTLTPAEGFRDEHGVSDLYDPEDDPTRRWSYFGQAQYDPEATNPDLTPEEAHTAFIGYLLDHGWKRTQGTPEDGETPFFKGKWDLTVFYTPDSSDRNNRNRVAFFIKSPSAGGPRLARPHSPGDRPALAQLDRPSRHDDLSRWVMEMPSHYGEEKRPDLDVK